MRLGRYGSIVGVCLGLAATGAGIVWPIDRDIGGALFVIGIGVVVVSSIWFVVFERVELGAALASGAPVLGLNESTALCQVEPFDSACSHHELL
jgi:hypothetical protein